MANEESGGGEGPRSGAPDEIESAIGLCARCRFVRRQGTGRGSSFFRCRRAEDDPRFLRYPPLPVRRCPGFDPGAEPRADLDQP